MNKSTLYQEAFFYTLIWLLLYALYFVVAPTIFDTNNDSSSFSVATAFISFLMLHIFLTTIATVQVRSALRRARQLGR